jgi:hypothetical protein
VRRELDSRTDVSYGLKRIPPSALIDVNDDAEIMKWARWLGTNEDEVLRAVEAVGPFAAAVRDYLAEEE